jgi:ankyrin repeat protein
MADESGETPLQRACSNRRSTLEDMLRRIDEDPQALPKRDWNGNTPLYMAFVHLPHPSPF